MAGDSDFTVSNLTITAISFATGESGELPNIYLITENLRIVGNIVIPSGDIQYSASAYFAGQFNLTYGYLLLHPPKLLTVIRVVSGEGPMLVEGSFFVGGIVRVGFNPLVARNQVTAAAISSLTLRYSTFSANTLYLGSFANLYANESTVYSNVEMFYNSTIHHRNEMYIFGNVNNDGEIRIPHMSNLTIVGTYFQGPLARLTFLDLDLVSGTAGQLSVSGPATIDGIVIPMLPSLYSTGAILFSLARVAGGSWKKEVLILQSTSSVSGKFRTSPSNQGSLLISHSSVSYTQNSVYLVFDITVGDGNTQWWIWLLVAVGIAIALGIFGFYFYMKKRGKTDYLELKH